MINSKKAVIALLGALQVNFAVCATSAEEFFQWARAGNESAITAFLESNRDRQIMDAANEHGWTPLMVAARNGEEKIVKLLLKAGVDIRAVNEDGWTALMLAGHENIVKLLLDKGSDVHAVEKDGWTALMLAARWGHENMVKLLLEAGADIEAADTEGDTALTLAAFHGHTEVVKVLLERDDINIEASDEDGYTALMCASQKNHAEVVRLLLDAGADVNQRNTKGWTSLMMASKDGHGGVVRMLLQAGAAVDYTTAQGSTALSLAKNNKKTTVMRLLQLMGADLRSRFESHWVSTGELFQIMLESMNWLDFEPSEDDEVIFQRSLSRPFSNWAVRILQALPAIGQYVPLNTLCSRYLYFTLLRPELKKMHGIANELVKDIKHRQAFLRRQAMNYKSKLQRVQAACDKIQKLLLSRIEKDGLTGTWVANDDSFLDCFPQCKSMLEELLVADRTRLYKLRKAVLELFAGVADQADCVLQYVLEPSELIELHAACRLSRKVDDWLAEEQKTGSRKRARSFAEQEELLPRKKVRAATEAALTVAVEYGHGQVVQAILRAGVDEKTILSLLPVAISAGRMDIAKNLVEALPRKSESFTQATTMLKRYATVASIASMSDSLPADKRPSGECKKRLAAWRDQGSSKRAKGSVEGLASKHLIEAIRSGNLEQVKGLLSKNQFDVSVQDESGYSPVMLAAQMKQNALSSTKHVFEEMYDVLSNYGSQVASRDLDAAFAS